MSSPSGQPASEIAVPAPGLLILTGASHTGKTSVAEAILRKVEAPAAFLSVDDVLSGTLALPPEDVWAEIPLAYELLRPQLETLLDRDWLVLLESTFTYVPESGPPEFHADELERLIGVAERRGVCWIVIQLSAIEDEAASRAERTGRLRPDVVAKTVELHESAALPDATLRLDSTVASPDELALRALAALSGGSRA